MQHQWNNETLEQFITTCPDGLPVPFLEQVYATRLVGSEENLALHGGGNTSYKGNGIDLLGDPVETLHIKASGCDMASVTTDDFVSLDLCRLRRLDRDMTLDDDAMSAFFTSAKVRHSEKQPSIETLLHAFLPFRCITHSHPAAILALTNRTDTEHCIKKAFSSEVPVIPYTEVGIALARNVASTIAAAPACSGIIIAQHGLVTWGNSAREAYDGTISLVTEAETWLDHNRTQPIAIVHDRNSVEKARKHYRSLAPIIRGCLSIPSNEQESGRISVSLVLLTDEKILSLLESSAHLKMLAGTPLTPDYIIRTGRLPLVLEHPELDNADAFSNRLLNALEEHRANNGAFLQRNAGSPAILAENVRHLPRVLLIPGLGAVCSGNTLKDTRIAADITKQSLRVKRTILESGGTWRDLNDEHCFNMEFRSYQRAKVASSQTHQTSTGRVVLVTGAAGAIGSGLCHSLLKQGYQVAVSDLPGQSLDTLIGELSETYGSHSIAPVAMDVTSESSVYEAFQKIIDRFGGLDAVVVNAGIAYVAPITEMDFSAFQRLERVNIEGTLLTIREAARLFKLQNTGGDIVLISTKNVFAPGASFGAYSATKAAAHQIARIASLEFASMDVRVNMVAPDAVFSHGTHKSGLWATVGPGRMKSRGLDEAGLEEYYRNRNLLKAKVTASHVAAAVEFFLERRTPTSGATIPVDGGLPDATPR